MNHMHSKITDFIIRYSAIALAFLIPVFLIPTLWATVAQSKVLLVTIFILVALISWLIGIILHRKILFSVDPILIAAIVIPIAYTLSAIFTKAPYSSFVSGDAIVGTVASTLMLLGVAIIGAVTAEDRKSAFTSTIALLISGGVVVLFHIGRLFWPDQLNLFGSLTGNTSSIVGSWHDLSIFVGALLIITLGLIETSITQNKIASILLKILALASFALLIVINFADIWFTFAGACVLFGLARILRSYRREAKLVRSLRSALLWFSLAIVSLVLALNATFVYSHLPAPLQISQVEVRPSWQGTFAAGQELYQGGKALIFGTGPNTFDQQWALFKPQEVNATNFWNAEFQSGIGVIPTALVTVGVAGTLGWLLLALALLWAGYKSIRDENEGRLRVILFVTCAFMLVFHIIYVPSIGISLIMFLLLGILAGLNANSWRSGALNLTGPSVTAFVLILFMVCSTIGFTVMESRSVVSTLFTARAADMYRRTNDLGPTSAMVAQAIAIDSQNDIAQRAAVEVGLLQLANLASTATDDEASQTQLKNALSSTIAHGLAAVSIDNSNYQNWLALAGLYQSLAGQGIQGAYEQAEAAWQRAASTTPGNPLPPLQLGQIAFVQGNYPAAKEHFTRAITLKPDLALPYYLRSQILAGEASWEAAVTDAANAAQLANQDPLGWYNLGVILYAAGDVNNAGASLEKAVSLQNNYSNALFALAVIYEKVGAHESAIAAAQKVVDLNPSNEQAVKVLENLKAGRPTDYGLPGSESQSSTSATSDQTKKN
jgi:tetratricopeptide (TPR) repeat protein